MALESNIARSINHGSVGIILIHCVVRYEKRNFYTFTKIFINLSKILNYKIVKAAVGTMVTYLQYIKLLHGENYMVNTRPQ